MTVYADLYIALDGQSPEEVLGPFRWLIPNNQRPLFVTAIGDLFLADLKGCVWWLDIGKGRFTSVAPSETEFWRLAQDAAHRDSWFGEDVVKQLRRSGLVRGMQECFCFKMLPMLGGTYDSSNFKSVDVLTHLKIWGPILESIWNIPDGAKIRFRVEP
jgi:hypothetical protein